VQETPERLEQLRNLGMELAETETSVRLHVAVDDEEDEGEEHGSDSEAVESVQLERVQLDQSSHASATDFVLKPGPGQLTRWLIRRSGAVAKAAAAAANSRTAYGPLELRVGQALRNAFTIALVDEMGNICRRVDLPRGVAPILTVQSGDDRKGPWLLVGLADSSGKGKGITARLNAGGAAPRARQLKRWDPNRGPARTGHLYRPIRDVTPIGDQLKLCLSAWA
jgi:hypothetical protein